MPHPTKTTDQYEDSFNECITWAIVDDPKDEESKQIVSSNVKVENLFETLATETIGEDLTESTSTTFILEYMAEQMQLLARQMDQISEILRK